MAYATTNPYTNEVLNTFPNATDAEVDEALDRAHEAFLSWRVTSFEDRAAVLSKAAALARQRRDRLAVLVTMEMGKLLIESEAEVDSIAEMFEYYAENGARLLAPRPLEGAPGNLVYEPLGIVYTIEPWNVPLYQAVRPMSAQLMAGNTVILKHASNVPQCAAAVADLMRDAGLPAGVFTNLYLTHAQSDRIIADPRVCGVTLTGSETAGVKVAAQAGANIKKCVLELEGSDGMIVLEDADMDHTVQSAIIGRLSVSGQACVADKRMIIVDSVYDEFLAKLVDATVNLRPGDPMDVKTTVAPVASRESAEAINNQIDTAVIHGATATLIGQPIPDRGAFVQPTILTGVAPDNPVYYEEIFGPVLMLFRVSDESEAIRLANDSPFGLGASVYSTDIERAKAVAAQIEAGMVTINRPTFPSPNIPFGGIKRSGFGRELGSSGIKEFVNQKVITQ